MNKAQRMRFKEEISETILIETIRFNKIGGKKFPQTEEEYILQLNLLIAEFAEVIGELKHGVDSGKFLDEIMDVAIVASFLFGKEEGDSKFEKLRTVVKGLIDSCCEILAYEDDYDYFAKLESNFTKYDNVNHYDSVDVIHEHAKNLEKKLGEKVHVNINEDGIVVYKNDADKILKGIGFLTAAQIREGECYV